MEALAYTHRRTDLYCPTAITNRSTLYDLIEAIEEEIEQGEEELIAPVVLDLIESHKVKWIRRHRDSIVC
jgi:hypothetical protein